MRRTILPVFALLAIFSAVKAAADTYIYDIGFFGNINQVGRVSGGSDSAILCGGSLCVPIVNCNACHTQPADQKRYAKEKENSHQKIHFPNAALRLGEGQQAKLGSILVSRTKGVLTLQDPKGQQFQLPPDAYVVRGKDGNPLFITYMGAKPPQILQPVAPRSGMPGPIR
ncbi:MAG: hypothetical protein GDA67_04650 [Nitrospira sp. CR1.3]|nr:hypothetical protein [Nitrospira sp. CR1.3]